MRVRRSIGAGLWVTVVGITTGAIVAIHWRLSVVVVIVRQSAKPAACIDVELGLRAAPP
jgi:hypothetical protein